MALKKFRQKFYKSDIPPVLVASFGRSGSTMVYKSVCQSMTMARFGRHKKFVCDNAWNLQGEKFSSGIVYKTHDFPTESISMHNLRTIFVFGSPIDAVRSVIKQNELLGAKWTDRHLKHLKARGTLDEIWTSDILGLERQLESWTTTQLGSVLCVKFDSLWDNISQISDFIELDFCLPPKKARTSGKLDEKSEALLAKTYSHMEKKVADLPPCFLSNERQFAESE